MHLYGERFEIANNQRNIYPGIYLIILKKKYRLAYLKRKKLL